VTQWVLLLTLVEVAELILSVHVGGHDSAVALFDSNGLLIGAMAAERVTRIKGDGGSFPSSTIDAVLQQAGLSYNHISVLVLSRTKILSRFNKNKPFFSRVKSVLPGRKESSKHLYDLGIPSGFVGENAVFDKERFLRFYGFDPTVQFFLSNHHLSHALSAYYWTSWDRGILYTADGGGDGVFSSAYLVTNGCLECLWGGENSQQEFCNSVGLLYGFVTELLGFKINRHEGKLVGLAAHGKPHLSEKFQSFFSVLETGEVSSVGLTIEQLKNEVKAEVAQYLEKHGSNFRSKADIAASAQNALQSIILNSFRKLQKVYDVGDFAVAGGVFANVRLNQVLAETCKLDSLFVFPAMADDGLAVGGGIHYMLEQKGASWLAANRSRLDSLYLGTRPYLKSDENKDFEFVELETDALADLVAQHLIDRKIIALVVDGVEFGPRALGARSILASPMRNEVNKWLNDRLGRTEFMPFAPVVLREHADDVFEIPESLRDNLRFMTTTVNVKELWKERIPAVVHVDGTARPQTIETKLNPLYYSIIDAFFSKTGIPLLVNTSFNAHEEPIIRTLDEALVALKDRRVDGLVTETGYWSLKA
jgi:carbamoyltransferase